MKRHFHYIFTGVLLLSGLACGTFGGASPTEPVATVPTVSTPTLAPTAPAPTVDPGATETVADGPTLVPTVEGGLAATPTSESGTGEDGGSNGSGNGGSPSSAACPAGGQNLLLNPSFEGQFVPYGAFVELNHAPPWIPWWKDGENNQRPEFKPAEIAVAANRVHSGNSAQQYFKSHGMFKAGLQQSVLSVPLGSHLQFSAHGQAWSCEEASTCRDGSSVNPSNMLMRVGIDPKGGTDPFSNEIKWSAYFNPLDQWQVACVEATSEAENVTVYLWASPDGPRQNQDVYWDDATLVILK
ncbi:MAG: hypothetical protein WA996_06445 [Candidatus Promineifilaceae bacterium]